MAKFRPPTPNPHLQRNGFDLSQRRIFSAPAGALLPIMALEVNPSEHFEINVQDFVRTQTLNTAAFARCKEYYHLFFVPNKALWRFSDEFFIGTRDANSALSAPLSGKVLGDGVYSFDPDWVPRMMPHFNLNSLHTRFSKTSWKNGTDLHGYSYKNGAARLLNLLGYGICPNFEYVSNNSSWLAKDSEEYKNRLGIIYASEKPKFGGKFNDKQNDPQGYSYMVNAARLMAYQRIYNDFYRNPNWEKSDVYSYNCDYVDDDSKARLSDEVAFRMCQLRYRNWSYDWLTSALPTPAYNGGIFELPRFSTGESRDTAQINRPQGDNGLSSVEFGIYGFLSVNDIRSAFALDKMLEVTRRANGYDYASQIGAHYGFKVKESRVPKAQYIGGFDNAINISEVLSTASTEVQLPNNQSKNYTNVGDVKGKGMGYLGSNNKIEFDVKEHGIIMCIYSIMPQTDYNAYNMDPFNRKLSREQYYQPEFANLGFDTLVTSDLVFSLDDRGTYQYSDNGVSELLTDSGSAPDALRNDNNQIIGYVQRYQEYKYARDLVHGEFMTDRSLSAWTTPRIDVTYTSKHPVDPKIIPEKFRLGGPLTAQNIKCDPQILNPIFGVAYNGEERTDQFLINAYFDIKAVRPMSVIGLNPI